MQKLFLKRIWVYLYLVTSLLILLATGRYLWVNICSPESVYQPFGDTSCVVVPYDLIPMLLAIGFWTAGLVAWLHRRRWPSIAFFLTVANVLASGLLSGLTPPWGSQLLYVFMSWASPFWVHFHLAEIQLNFRKIERHILLFLYGLASLWTLPLLFFYLDPESTIASLRSQGWFAVVREGVRFNLIFAVMITGFFLVYSYKKESTYISKQKIRLLTFGSLFSIVPLLLLSVFPNTLGLPYVPYFFTFPWLLIIPLIHIYSAERRLLVNTEKTFSNILRDYLLITSLLSVFFLLTGFAQSLPKEIVENIPLVNVLSVGILIVLVAPFRQRIGDLVYWVFYGPNTSHDEILTNFSDELKMPLNRNGLQEILLNGVTAISRPAQISIYLKAPDHKYVFAFTEKKPSIDLGEYAMIDLGRIADFLIESAVPLEKNELIKRGIPNILSEMGISKLIEFELWVPLIVGGTLQGLILLRLENDDDFFTTNDKNLLEHFAGQAAIAVQNVFLTEDVVAGKKELEKAHQRLLISQEQERRKVAQELHDGAVQQLLGISYQLMYAQKKLPLTTEMKNEQGLTEIREVLEEDRLATLDVANKLREIIGDLRPAGLDEQGVFEAIEDYVSQIRRRSKGLLPKIEFYMERDNSQLSEQITICLFRTFQEALRNSINHANANQISIRLEQHEREIILVIEDDGVGFEIPSRLSEFASENHFGLIGIRERIAWVGGEVHLQSQYHKGTVMTVKIPLIEGNVRHEKDSFVVSR